MPTLARPLVGPRGVPPAPGRAAFRAARGRVLTEGFLGPSGAPSFAAFALPAGAFWASFPVASFPVASFPVAFSGRPFPNPLFLPSAFIRAGPAPRATLPGSGAARHGAAIRRRRHAAARHRGSRCLRTRRRYPG
ncbi:MAG: hypothetical protein Kow0058_03810 [Roseovarius sp.]